MFQDRDSLKTLSNNRTIGTLQITFGGILSFLFGLTSLALFADLLDPYSTTSFSNFMIVFVIFGVSFYMLIRGLQRIHFANTCSYYMKILYQGPSHSIEQMAVLLKTSKETVRSNLDRMITKGFLACAYIDDNTNRIVCTMNNRAPIPVPDPLNASRMTPNSVLQSLPQKPPEVVTANCVFCGAPNKLVRGVKKECEYCGSIIIVK